MNKKNKMAPSGLASLILLGPFRLVKTMALKIVFLPRKTIESILFTAIIFAILEIGIDSLIREMEGTFSLTSGTLPLVVRIAGLLFLIMIYFWYEVYNFKIYRDTSIIKTSKESLAKADENENTETNPDTYVISTDKSGKEILKDVERTKNTQNVVKNNEIQPWGGFNDISSDQGGLDIPFDDLDESMIPNIDELISSSNDNNLNVTNESDLLDALMGNSQNDEPLPSEIYEDSMDGDKLDIRDFRSLREAQISRNNIPATVRNSKVFTPKWDLEKIAHIEQQVNSEDHQLDAEFIELAHKKLNKDDLDCSSILERFRVPDYFEQYA